MRIPVQYRSRLKWLLPGLGVKRWLLVMAAGIALIGLGIGVLFLQLRPLAAVSLGLSPWVQVLLLTLSGGGLVALGLARLNRALLAPFAQGDVSGVAETLYRYRLRERGPKVVAIGGGHGLSTLLRGLKEHTVNITAIVTVADDGGSSGRLRRSLGVLPPGDFRNCLAALADDEALLTQLFQYRFPSTPGDSGLNGHSLGNLFITAMTKVTGSFERAVVESSRVLAVQGRVIPSTLQSVTLLGEVRADSAALSRVSGESSIAHAVGTIERVYLEPGDAPAFPQAVQAILEADLIVAGPGSLYTSILPNLLVREVAAAIAASRATRIYVCNVATQRGETDGYSVGDHVAALERHVGPGLFPIVLANDDLTRSDELPEGIDLTPLHPAPGPAYTVYTADLVDPVQPWRHDSEKLARILMQLIN